MKRALVIRHVPVEGVAGFRAPIEDAGFIVDRIDVTDPGFSAVDFLAPDLIVMMGGPMGAYESDAHPWIACQIARLSERMAADRPTLGVCLGAQMMAAALGAHVYPGGRQEVGFAPIALNPVGAASPLRHLEDVSVLHWHGDTFDLPEGTELLASTGTYERQAFRRGSNLLALQFHAEMGEDPRFDSWLDKWPDAITAAGRCATQMRVDHDEHGPVAVAAGRRMIVEWLAGLRV